MSIIHTKSEYNIRTPLHLCTIYTTYAACKSGRVNCKNLTFISTLKLWACEQFSRHVIAAEKTLMETYCYIQRLVNIQDLSR